jgi:hypothetical protein
MNPASDEVVARRRDVAVGIGEVLLCAIRRPAIFAPGNGSADARMPDDARDPGPSQTRSGVDDTPPM